MALMGAFTILSTTACLVCAKAIQMGIANPFSLNALTSLGKLFFTFFTFSTGARVGCSEAPGSGGAVTLIRVAEKASRIISRPPAYA